MRDGDFSKLKKRLEQFYSPQEAEKFLRSPQKHLEGLRPVDCTYAQVSRLINQMEQYL